MKRIWFALLLIVSFVGCSSDDSESNNKDSRTVTLSDIKGTWQITDASPSNVVGVRLVLNDNTSCVWSDKFGNTFSGPYYFLENVNDDVLKAQCALVGSETNSKIHISEAKVIGKASGNTDLYIMCDLMPLLPAVNWQYFDEKVNRSAWYFWESNWFKYTFEITEYTENSMRLKLSESLVRFEDYESDYPLRLSVGTVFTLKRLK